MTEAEKYVRSKWEIVSWGANNYELTQFGVILYNDADGIAFKENSQDAAWQAAYDFTIAREEEIKQIEAEIKWIESLRQSLDTMPVRIRICRRLESTLSELKRGLREANHTDGRDDG